MVQEDAQLPEVTSAPLVPSTSSDLFSALATAFNSARGGLLSHAIKSAAKNTINTANHCDHYKNDTHRPYTSGLLNTIVKTFNSSLAERTLYDAAGVPKLGKKAAMLDLANCLFRLYLKLREHRIVTTIFDNLSSCGVPLEVPHFPRATLVTYHYYRGLHNLHNAAFLTSHAALTKSYALCSRRFIAQRRRILVPLMSVSLILGLIPHPDLFARPESTELRELFTPIYIAIRRGDFRTFRQGMGIEDALSEDTSWRQAFWLKHHVYYALCHRLQPQLWRGLIRRVALLKESAGPLMLRDVAVCARYVHLKQPVATQPPNPLFHGPEPEDLVVRGEADDNSWFMDGLTLTVADVEAAVESVLDQGFVKGYLARLEGGPVLVLSKQEPFPKVWGVFEGGRWAAEEEAPTAVEEGVGRVVRLSGVKGIGEK